MPVFFPSPALAAISFTMLLLVSCGRPTRVEVVQSRDPFQGEAAPKTGFTTAQRYAANEAQSLLQWKTPEGWNFLPATEFRHLNFDFGPNREGEVYLTLLPEGSGVTENLNRWRQQMGQPPLTPEEAGALPKKMLFSRPATFLDVEGTFSSGGGPMMQATETKPGYRMLGVIMAAPGAIFTIKMTGPSALIAANAGKFDAFCQSLGFGGDPGRL